MSHNEDFVAPDAAADSVEINIEKTSSENVPQEITSEIIVEVGSKRERSPSSDTPNVPNAPNASAAMDAPNPSVKEAKVEAKMEYKVEVKVAPRERKSRFSEKPAELPVTSELTAMASSIASVINAQLSGMQGSVLQTQSQAVVTPREMRELFVGNVLATVSDQVLKEFLNSAMRQVGLALSAEDPIVTCRMSAKFSFIELRTTEDSRAALNLNGIPFMGQCLKISRPSKYVGPPYQAKTWQEMTGQAPVSSMQAGSSDFVADPATKALREIFVGNTAPEMTDVLIKSFLGGALQEMGLSCSGAENPIVSVRVNGKFSFAEFRTMEEAANALNLNGIPFMGQSLKLSRPSKFEANTLCTFYSWDELLKKFISGELKLMTAGVTSKVIRIDNMVSPTELNDSQMTEEVVQDTMSECSQFGKVLRVIIPRPESAIVKTTGGPGGIGKVFVEMSSEEEAKLTLVNLKGRKFDGKWVDVKFYPLHYFKMGEFGEHLPSNVVCTMGSVPIDRVIQSRGVGGVGVGVGGGGQQGSQIGGFQASSNVSAMMSSAGIQGMQGGYNMGGMQSMGNMGGNMYGGNMGALAQQQPAPGGNIGGLKALNAYQLQELQKLGVRMP